MHGVVTAPQPDAVEVGRRILAAGGNAIDAAVATAFAQALPDPQMNGIGGNGTLHVLSGGRDVVIDFYGRAPLKARPDMFADRVVRQMPTGGGWELEGHVNEAGYLSVTAPGTVMGLCEVHSRFGSLPWTTLIEPAIALAEEGITVSGELYSFWQRPAEPGALSPWQILNATPAMAAIYTSNDQPYKPGEVLRNPDYAAGLREIAAHGPDAVYRGAMAQRISDDFAHNGGLLCEDDFTQYRVRERQPVVGTYRGHTISSNPPPGSGAQVVEILNILEGYDLAKLGFGTPEYWHTIIQAQRASFADRVRYLADPDFAYVPTDVLTSKDRAAYWRARIDAGEAIMVGGPAQPKEGTTTVSAMDEAGNAINITHTLGTPCSGVVVPGLGFPFNNSMHHFHPRPGHPNSIAPGKARTTGMSPTIVYKDGKYFSLLGSEKDKPWLVLGAPGATKILTAIAQAIVNVIDHGMTPTEAVSAPRVYCEGGAAYVEARAYPSVAQGLAARGHRLVRSECSFDRFFATVHMIKSEDGKLTFGADPRGGGGGAVC